MPKVTFTDTGDQADAEEGGSLKDLTKNQGWPIAYGCEDGVCGTCIVEVKEGKENLNEMEEVEDQTLDMMGMKDGNHRLCCQCKVKGDVSIKGM
ncbi:MAG: 2Fe-2S iron-sulfur cluster-binding protein [bacterium]|nr:2Fe-2S iron-sulfur cluster-binding protein [bacterium]